MFFSKLLATFAGTLLLTPSAKVNGVTQFALPSYSISPQRNGINISFQPFLTSDVTTSGVTTSSVTQFHVKSGSDDEHYVGTTETTKQTLNVLIRNGEIAVGSIVDEEDGNVYKLWRNEFGDLLVTETHTSEFPDESDPVENEVPIRHLREKDSTSFQERNLQKCPLHVIDVLVPWTAEAECKQSNLESDCTRTTATAQNMQDLIQLAVAETNTAYQNSGVKVNDEVARLNLVHAYCELSINENFGLEDILDQMIYISQIAAKRSQYGADVVASIASHGQYCGQAYGGPHISSMYSVSTISCTTGNFSFGHEIGHNMGAIHDRGTSKACNSLNYNYGFRDPNGGFRSIMAYDCVTWECDKISKSGCPKVQRFSNNDILYHGKAIGSAVADNAKQHSETFATVSGYYDCKTGYPSSSPTGNPSTSPTVTLTSSPTVTHTVNPTTSQTVTPSSTPTLTHTKAPTVKKTWKGCIHELKDWHQKRMDMIVAEHKKRVDSCPTPWKFSKRCKRNSKKTASKAIGAANTAITKGYKKCRKLYKGK